MPKFYHSLSNMEIAEQVAGLLNSYNQLSYSRTGYDVLSGRIDYLVESHGKDLIGICGIERLSYQFTEIKHLVTRPEWRRKGVASWLLQRTMNLGATPLLYATVRKDNGASLNLFKNSGFQETAAYPAEEHEVVLLVRKSPKWKETKPSWKSALQGAQSLTGRTSTTG